MDPTTDPFSAPAVAGAPPPDPVQQQDAQIQQMLAALSQTQQGALGNNQMNQMNQGMDQTQSMNMSPAQSAIYQNLMAGPPSQ